MGVIFLIALHDIARQTLALAGLAGQIRHEPRAITSVFRFFKVRTASRRPLIICTSLSGAQHDYCLDRSRGRG